MAGRVQVNLDWKGPEVVRATKDAARKALWRAAEEIRARANALAPLDSGILKATADTHMEGMPEPENGPLTAVGRDGKVKTVIRPPLGSVDAGDLAVSIFYNTPYAARLHEHPGYEFQGGREGKWLETTISEDSSDILKWLEEELEKEF